MNISLCQTQFYFIKIKSASDQPHEEPFEEPSEESLEELDNSTIVIATVTFILDVVP